MDERRGRRRAIQSGLTVTGTLGILVEAKRRGKIGSLRPLLEKLRLLPFHMSDELFDETVNKVGE
jgi:predicted nucleic acid-binding protein